MAAAMLPLLLLALAAALLASIHSLPASDVGMTLPRRPRLAAVRRCGRPSTAARQRTVRAAAPWDGLFGSPQEEAAVRVPATVEELAEALQDSMALALARLEKGRRPRLDVELPPGLPLGIESALGPLVPPASKPSAAEVDRGDRELASAFLLLFEGLKRTGALCIAFRTERLATAARRLWKEWGKTRIAALQGFGGDDALRRAMRRPFLVAVAPGTQELRRLSELADERGDKLCLILLNARIRGTPSAGGDDVRGMLALESEAVFHFRFVGAGGDGVLYRAGSAAKDGKKSPWVVVRRSAADGPQEQVLCSDTEPSTAAAESALSGLWR
mmetsp:Transcript_415/g.1395  ORF Transcript_415/g.1395 Transcript_415/m.1395 type:complete len:330 (+) Transcript_415:25-1014(+)